MPSMAPAIISELPMLLAASPRKANAIWPSGLLAVLAHGQHVGQDLGRMELVGQAVEHRHAGVVGERLDEVLVEAAVLDAVVQPAEHTRRVLDRLLVAHLRRLRVEIGHVRALVVRGHLERAARARRGLLEDQADLLLAEVLLLSPVLLGRLEVGRQVEQVAELVGREVELLEEVAALE